MRFGGWLHPLQAGFSGLATGRGCGGPCGRTGDAPISRSFDPCRSSWIKTVRPILRMQGTTTPQLHFDIHPTFWTLTVASMWVAWFDPCGRTPRTVRLSPWCVNARRGLGRTQSYCTRCVWSVVTPDQFRKASGRIRPEWIKRGHAPLKLNHFHLMHDVCIANSTAAGALGDLETRIIGDHSRVHRLIIPINLKRFISAQTLNSKVR